MGKKKIRRNGRVEGEDAIAHTINVGASLRPGGVIPRRIPRGLEVLIKKAAVDPAFKKLLFEKKAEAAQAIAAGHSFVIMLRNIFPVNVLNAVKSCPEVCRIFCATANPLQVIVAEAESGRGIVGVIDGSPPKGVEGPADVTERQDLLKKIGYKR